MNLETEQAVVRFYRKPNTVLERHSQSPGAFLLASVMRDIKTYTVEELLRELQTWAESNPEIDLNMWKLPTILDVQQSINELMRDRVIGISLGAAPALVTPKAKAKPEGFYLLWTRPDSSKPRSMQSPNKTYPLLSFDQAVVEAEKMARTFPEQKFYVMKAVQVIERVVQTNPVELR